MENKELIKTKNKEVLESISKYVNEINEANRQKLNAEYIYDHLISAYNFINSIADNMLDKESLALLSKQHYVLLNLVYFKVLAKYLKSDANILFSNYKLNYSKATDSVYDIEILQIKDMLSGKDNDYYKEALECIEFIMLLLTIKDEYFIWYLDDTIAFTADKYRYKIMELTYAKAKIFKNEKLVVINKHILIKDINKFNDIVNNYTNKLYARYLQYMHKQFTKWIDYNELKLGML